MPFQNLIWNTRSILDNTWAMSTDGLKMQREALQICALSIGHPTDRRAGKLRKLDKEVKALYDQVSGSSSCLCRAQFWLGGGGVHTSTTFGLVQITQCICPCIVYFSTLSNVFLHFVKCELSFDWAAEEGTPLSHLEEHTSEPQGAWHLTWKLTRPYSGHISSLGKTDI